MMFLARVNSKGMSGNKYWYNQTYNKGANTPNALPNCTTFCVGESLEALQAQVPMSFFVAPYDRDGAFPDASQWYKLWKGKKGLEPKPGGVCVWEGGNGHVAFVLETRDAGSKGAWVKVCQSNYKGVYFEVKEYYVKVGQVTTGVGKKYVGCVYNDVQDLRTTRNKNLEQVEVLTDSLNARTTPNGVVYAGRRVLKGIYTIFDKMHAGDYAWAQLDKDTWIALNDKDGWTKTYDIENCEARYRTLLSAYEKLSQKYSDLLIKYERETGKKP